MFKEKYYYKITNGIKKRRYVENNGNSPISEILLYG